MHFFIFLILLIKRKASTGGGRREDNSDRALYRRSLRVHASCQLSWRVKVLIKKIKNTGK